MVIVDRTIKSYENDTVRPQFSPRCLIFNFKFYMDAYPRGLIQEEWLKQINVSFYTIKFY